MFKISNIWKHPKTSAAGVLIAVATTAGALSQQGVGLGKAGNGTVVSLAAALATAFLGLLARDPAVPAAQPASGTSSQQAKLGAWALIALLLPLPWMQGCTGTGVAQDIVNWTPALQGAVTTVDSTAALLAPAAAPVFVAATAGFDVASNLLASQAEAYLANPSASALSELQNQIVVLQQQVNSALLDAARITDLASQQHALVALQAVSTIVTAILALVQSVSTKAQVAQMAAHSAIKLAAVKPWLNGPRADQIVARHYSEPVTLAQVQVEQAEQYAAAAGL